jgi:hypothetical protein
VKKYFISFGNKNFKNQLIRLCKTAKETNWFDGVIADDPNTIEDFIKNHEGFILKSSIVLGSSAITPSNQFVSLAVLQSLIN